MAPSLSSEELLNQYIERSLSSIDENGDCSFLLTEDEINELLATFICHTEVAKNIVLEQVTVELSEDGTIHATIPLHAFGIGSIVKARVVIQENQGSFTILLKDFELGSLSSSSSFVKNVLFKMIPWSSIEKNLAKEGIQLHLTVQDGIQASMGRDELIDTLKLAVTGETSHLLLAIVEECLGNDEFISFDFNEDLKIGAVLHLGVLHANGTVPNDLKKQTADFENVFSNVQVLKQEGQLTCANTSVVLDYLVRGYSNLTEDQQELILALSWDNTSITFPKLYSGIVKQSSISMRSIFSTAADLLKIPTIILKGYYDVTITEELLNGILYALPFSGTTLGFLGEAEVAYVTIQSITCKLEENKLTLMLYIDVNGYDIVATIESNVEEESHGTSITLKIGAINLGTLPVEEVAKEELLMYVSSILKDSNIYVDVEKETLQLDFTDFIEQEFYKSLIQGGLSNLSIHINDGELVLRLAK